jgi:hypothetical protein
MLEKKEKFQYGAPEIYANFAPHDFKRQVIVVQCCMTLSIPFFAFLSPIKS